MFYLEQPVVAAKDTTIEGTVAMVRQADNPRLYNVKVSLAPGVDCLIGERLVDCLRRSTLLNAVRLGSQSNASYSFR